MKSFAAAAILLGVTLTFTGCGGKSESKDDGGVTVDQSSPEKVAESFKAAAKAKDWNAMFACMTEDSQKTLTAGMMLGAAFSTFGDDKKKDSFEELVKKHGLDPQAKPKPGEDPTAGVKDKAAFFGDIVTWLEENTPKDKGGSMTEKFASAELSNFKIDGDKATAEAIVDGKKDNRPLEFKKIDGKWYLDFASSMGKKRPRGPRFPKKTGS